MIGGFFRQNGISIVAYNPSINPSAGTYIPRFEVADGNLISKIQSYSHEKDNEFGYKTISITLGDQRAKLDDWYENGIGRHIEVYNEAGEIIHAGFVNRVTLTSNAMQASRGPLIDICNRCSVMYTPITDTSVSPPLTGAEKSTIIADDVDSQFKYGIIEKVLSGGQLLDDGTTDEAEDYRDRFLNENREPNTGDKGLSIGNSGDTAIQLEILGYYAWLDLYIYSTITTGTIIVSNKIISAISSDPNGIFSTDYSFIETNNLLTAAYDNENNTAKTVIENLVSRGNDTDDNRRIFGVFERETIKYSTIPDEFEYYYSLSSRDQNIRVYNSGNGGQIVRHWNIEPGKWLFISDFLPGRFTDITNKKDDPRAMFIESISFSAPHGVSLNGVGINELPQYLAKLGVK